MSFFWQSPPVLDCFSNVRGTDAFDLSQICNRAGYLECSMVGTCREAKALYGLSEQNPGPLIKGAMRLYSGYIQMCVEYALARELVLVCCDNPVTDFA